jgi:hypothetical protein
MNTLLKAPAGEAEAVDLCQDDVGVVRKVNGSSPDQGRSELGWLKASARMLDCRRDALERGHWRKVWRSMVED